jgi:dUTP pyrophosphatase
MSIAKPTLKIVRLSHNLDLPLPRYETSGSAGLDLPAAISEEIVLGSLERAAIPTGLKMAIPFGYEGQVRPRSGLAFRHGISITNSPGTIDSDYRGELKVLVINLGKEPVTITRGMRIAQLVIAPVQQVDIVETQDLDSTARGDGGFGSTGMN